MGKPKKLVNDPAGAESGLNVRLGLVERLRELDKKGYQPLTGAIGNEAANEIERLLEKCNLASDVLNAHDPLLPLKDEYRHLLVKVPNEQN